MGQEQFFTCPYCFQTISMVLETCIEGTQQYIEDCEVCCRPIQVQYEADGNEIISFDSTAVQLG
ncbi:MAG: CPXCG motif-containing cysteine-rich protein [Proteobacteria bacterium]|nr:CPXCG motif-containing cysteine-rich protein [Pseudomonadota bacterium]NDC24633.1 CPXCG motif-containing cysteine-rich protein [Pseudomonadota bacterium]NDD03404.1 CPXCG motif-containing cysteine-rich protein [Pseudomonadota bacterium]NDG26983.1 CPXCG motif-containing cysteine-rich protein [Pseudomonadota bacterium]